MRTTSVVLSGLLRSTTCFKAGRSLYPLLLHNPNQLPVHQPRKCVHLSPALSAKTLLHKFSTKSKKKHWHDSPSFMRRDDKPQGLMSLMKVQQKEKRGNNVRIKILNSILYKALTGLLCTAEVSEEVFNLQIQLSKVSVTVDFSVCRAYWLTSGDKETDAQIATVLQKYASRFRHLLITHQVLGNVPTIVFLKDQDDAKRQEIEDLLATLDFGDSDPTAKSGGDTSRILDSSSVSELSAPSSHSVLGIDHIELNNKITEYKKKMKEKQIENVSTELPVSQQQQEQLAEIKKQQLLKKKLRKQRWTEHNNMSPQDFILASDSSLYSDNREEYDVKFKVDIEEKEDGGRS